MFKPTDTKARTLHRIKIIQGHLMKVRGMIESDEYCIDIIHQSQVIQSALQKIDELVMENHLTSCVADAIKKGDDEKAVREVMSVFKKRKI